MKKKAQHKTLDKHQKIFLSNYPLQSSFAEAYRTLRTNINFSFMEKKFRTLLITSAGAREGKTVTAVNLAYTMSLAGKSVLMIDADMRNPLLTRLFTAQESLGISGLVANIFHSDLEKGSLGEFGISDLFKILSIRQKTGLLQLNNQKEQVEIFFLDGKIKDLNWITRPEKKKLAAELVKNRLITKEHVELALRSQKDTGQKLGFILINMGLLKEDNLKGPLTIHMIEGLRTVMQMNTGVFSFKELGDSEFEKASFDPVDLESLYRQALAGKEPLPFVHKKISEAIVETDVANLSLLGSGRLLPSPSELLGSEQMSFLLFNLKKRFDRIIIDTPPILPASDAVLLSSYADGVIVVIRAGHTNRKMVNSAVNQLRMAKANIIGVAFNYVDTKKEGYYKYYHKYYSGYYGERT